MTLRNLIEEYKKYIDDEIELEGIYFIIEETLNYSRSSLLLNLDKDIDEISLLKNRLDDYAINHIPAQYIIGYTYFYGLKFNVCKNVLIPRFDTEILVDSVIEYIKSMNKTLDIIDIGSGSGCINISIKKNIECNMDACDISDYALNCSKINAKDNNVNINYFKNDLLDNIDKKYDIIISNPPYIDEEEVIDKLVRDNEPSIALFAKDKGLYFYKKILLQSLKNLKENGIIFFEIPDNKCNDIVNIASMYYNDIKIIEDYHHLKRVLKIGGRK